MIGRVVDYTTNLKKYKTKNVPIGYISYRHIFSFVKNYAWFTEPNNSIFSLTVDLIASRPGPNNLRGS